MYIVGSPDAENAAAQKRFAQALGALPGGPGLGFTADDVLPHGTSWNTAPAEPRRSFGRWFAARSASRLATGFEIPYGLAKGNLVTPGTARRFGRSLALALTSSISMENSR